MALRVGASHSKSVAYLILCPWVFCKWRCNRFNLWRDFTRPPHWGVIQISGCEFLAVCHHPDKFGDHGHRESGDMFLICHVTKPDHMFKWLLYGMTFHGKSPPCQVGGYWLSGSGDIKYLICHLTSPNHVIKGLCNLYLGTPHCMYVTTLVTKFGGHRYCDNRDVFSLSRYLARPRD